ncbi:MAG: hypothetical protein HC853_02565 [Anaerolineae bacterium]|nr:hypothetical protein [Anaerolineae bacterium]
MVGINASSRISAVVSYIPVIGWLYGLVLQRNNAYVRFHARQSFGLFVILLAIFVGWAVLGWLLGWIPFGFIFSNALFAIVMAAFVAGLIAWINGIVNAAQGRVVLLPIFGKRANRLPV